jgi:hypothetical protein
MSWTKLLASKTVTPLPATNNFQSMTAEPVSLDLLLAVGAGAPNPRVLAWTRCAERRFLPFAEQAGTPASRVASATTALRAPRSGSD